MPRAAASIPMLEVNGSTRSTESSRSYELTGSSGGDERVAGVLTESIAEDASHVQTAPLPRTALGRVLADDHRARAQLEGHFDRRCHPVDRVGERDVAPERRRVPFHVQREQNAARWSAAPWPCSDGLVPVSIAALDPTPELGASDLDRLVLHLTRLLAENRERPGEVAVLGGHAVDAELRHAPVDVECGDADASLCCREAEQPAAAIDAAREDEALDADLIEGSSNQRQSFGECGSDAIGQVRVARCRRRAPQPPGHVLFGEPFDGGGVGTGVSDERGIWSLRWMTGRESSRWRRTRRMTRFCSLASRGNSVSSQRKMT